MATIINNPDTSSDGGGMGAVLGVLLLVVLVVLLLVFGLPALRGNSGNNTGAGVNVPDKVQVDINDNTGN